MKMSSAGVEGNLRIDWVGGCLADAAAAGGPAVDSHAFHGCEEILHSEGFGLPC